MATPVIMYSPKYTVPYRITISTLQRERYKLDTQIQHQMVNCLFLRHSIEIIDKNSNRRPNGAKSEKKKKIKKKYVEFVHSEFRNGTYAVANKFNGLRTTSVFIVVRLSYLFMAPSTVSVRRARCVSAI